MNNDYSDIIGLPHHVSDKRPRMSREKRAAQFSPFAALDGYEDAINDATDEKNKSDDKGIPFAQTDID